MSIFDEDFGLSFLNSPNFSLNKQYWYPGYNGQLGLLNLLNQSNLWRQNADNIFNEYLNSLNGSPLTLTSNLLYLGYDLKNKSPWYANLNTYADDYDWNQYDPNYLKDTGEIWEGNPEVTITNPLHKMTGTRFYYRDEQGNRHYVQPDRSKDYYYDPNKGETTPWGNITFTDYELTGPRELSINGAPSQQFNGLKVGGTPINKDEKVNWFKNIDWKGLGYGLKKIAPNILEDVRLAGNLYNNERVYKTMLEGIRPNLMLSYQTHRQVVGDEATKLAYYRRGAEGVTRASQAFTSDADRLMAYLMEAQRQANELRAQGDLADNQEIRRTSDESNLHQWANTLRRTEVANLNTAQINAANQAKQNLLALKHSANWSSWENYLYGREARWRQKQQEDKALADLIWQLDRYGLILEDPLLLDILSRLEAAYKKPENLTLFGTINYNSKEIKALLLELRKRQLELLKETYELQRARNSGIFIAKSGTKVTYKKKDDLLYKTTKDIVEHFRAMTKLTDDSYLKSRKKVPKLTPHPKGTKKYLLGGVAPFTVFRPVTLGGEQSITTQAATSAKAASSTKDDSGKDLLNLVKDLFSKMSGLPVDISAVYAPLMSLMQRVQVGGPELSTQEISTIYIQSMLLMSQLLYNLKAYEEAQKQAIANGSLEDLVITNGGKILVLNTSDGSLKPMSWDEYKKSDGEYRLLTNGALLELRAHSPNLAFNSDVLRYVSGTVGISKVAEEIKKLAGNIKATELEKQGFTKKEAGQIIKGLEELNDAPKGVYKWTLSTKDLESQMKAALKYISQMLPLSMLNTLKVYADINGVSPTEIIANGLAALEEVVSKVLWQPLTGKAASGTNGGSNGGENDMIPAVAFFNGLGDKNTFVILDKTNDGIKINTISAPITKGGANTGNITFDKLENSDFGGQLNMNLATMGDSLISSVGRLNILIDGRIYLTELPIDKEAQQKGIIKPDFKFLKKMEEVHRKLRDMKIDESDPKNAATINKVYQDNNLPIVYTISDNKLKLTSDYARFAIVNGIGTEEAFEESPDLNSTDGVLKASDKEREQFELLMKLQEGHSKYSLNNPISIFGISFGGTDLYKGTIYIPMVTSNISALGGTGYKAKGSEYNEIEALQLAADAAREIGFTPAGDASVFKNH